MTLEVTIKELSDEYSISTDNISQLIHRGILPKGRRDGRQRYLPEVECRLILMAHKANCHWKPSKKPRGITAKRRAAQAKQLQWGDVL